MAYLGLSRRAVLDLEDVARFSENRWGSKVAQEYLEGIQEALARLRQNPELLRAKPQISAHFRFYRVRQHWLVCVQAGERIYVLAVKHGAMNLPERLAELEPELLHEAAVLHRTFLASRSKG